MHHERQRRIIIAENVWRSSNLSKACAANDVTRDGDVPRVASMDATRVRVDITNIWP